ncbi:MAG: methyltransferase domain-containing protein [Pseudomonadota bacterium]
MFDHDLMRRRLLRAETRGATGFLAAHAGGDMADRLAMVTRTFETIATVWTPVDGIRALALDTDRSADGKAKARRVVHVVPGSAPGLAGSITGTAEALPLAPASFDLIASSLGLTFANDLPGALIQIARALKPDGLFMATMLGGDTLKELRQAFTLAEADITGGASPRVAPFIAVREAGGLLQRAGLALPVADTESITVRYAHPLALFQDLRAMGATNMLLQRSRTPMTRRLLGRLIEAYGDIATDPDGRVRATFEIVHLSGWAPHESQQKPLRPGSARAKLAEALGTSEESAGEKAG